MLSASHGAVVRWSAVLVALVALSPVPLALPSGIALAVIGILGAAVVLRASQRSVAATATVGLLRKAIDDPAGRRSSGVRA